MIVRSHESAPRPGRIALLFWAASVVALTAALDQLVFASIQSNIPFAFAMLAVLVLGAPFALGLVGGARIRVRQPVREVFLLAALGAGSVFVTLDVIWNATPAACTEPVGCDIALGVGAMLFAAGSYVAFLSGALIARFAVRRRARRRADGRSATQ